MHQSLRMAAALLLALPAVAPAQRPVIDEGTLLVSRNGTRAGRESFRIQAAENGRFLTATGQSVLGDARITPALSVDSASGTPMLYRVEARAGGASERLQATGRPGRLSAAFHRAGGESAKEYVLSGHVVVLDDDVYHQYGLLPLLGWTGRVTVIVPRQGSQQAGTLVDRGAATVRVDGKDVPSRHLVLELAGGHHDIWVDSRGRLLRVAIPSRGVDVVREELP
jgi:hypothetical protein